MLSPGVVYVDGVRLVAANLTRECPVEPRPIRLLITTPEEVP
jgi:hypothetical protein